MLMQGRYLTNLRSLSDISHCCTVSFWHLMHMERRKYIRAEIRMVPTTGMHFKSQYNDRLDAWCLTRKLYDCEEGQGTSFVTQPEMGLNPHTVMPSVYYGQQETEITVSLQCAR